MDTQAIDTQKIVEWFRGARRDLPWRRPGTTAWGVLVSEVMSQQTPVARVAPVWEEWMQRWPTPADFATASKAEVLRAWGKLGYPRRALRLWECAQQLADAPIPSTIEELQALPGIGQYTAAAVACFHYGRNVPVVDTNVRRVYARALDGDFLAPPPRARELVRAAELLPAKDGPLYSVAVMELGALVCTARSPQCQRCPLLDTCAWQLAGCPEPASHELAAAKMRVQKFTGTDRQVRGLIMDVLRRADTPVSRSAIDVVWPDAAQRSRALASLLADGLAEQDAQQRFHLPA
ncbi:A/G-specific adenine glycosylase [Corynebacterium lizhenjunii]|uniref:Adenine DNA glycosylase n=1 Tax=Corynebacterium lizhenjunii TaxID=2709394 RepID=A0A7T0KES6_9CORY|nr:A/G-specific adenine glycosylase [Corynebacterium lizhenjunii]QPK79461.1 A/G-specific adenine glycosylase [Corynebacterium lizhenjunii]